MKQMKDKTHITIMVCATSDGTKVPLSVIGKPKKPVCFSLVEGEKPLLLCKNQANASLNKSVATWWIIAAFWPFHLRTQGDVEAALVLDNCAAHEVDISDARDKLLLVFSPPSVTSLWTGHQQTWE